MNALRGKIYDLGLTLTGRRQQHIFLKKLHQMESASASEVSEIQEKLLGDLINHAYSNVPYYRQVIDNLGGLKYLKRDKPTALLNRMPLLSKDILRNHFNELKSQDLEHRKWYYNTSGGSTGEPAKFIQDWTYHQWGSAVSEVYDRWTGYWTGMPKVLLWGSERDLLVGKETLKTRIARKIKNEFWLNTFRMTENDMINYVKVINEVRPVQILAYVESIYELSRFIERKGLDVYTPKAIMTSAGTLFPYMRDVIERVFQAPVFNRYGSREVGAIACECEAHAGLHISPLTNYVEILRKNGTIAGPGEVGEVVVTSLSNYSMPLIRYRIGDLAVWAEEDCPCGRKWPLLKEVSGRINSIITTKKGAFASEAIGTLLYFKDSQKSQPFESFSRYQLVQRRQDMFVLNVVVQDSELWDEECSKILTKLKKTLGEDVTIQVNCVDEIRPASSGKFNYILSELT